MPMPSVAFSNVPNNLLTPFWFAEINSGGSPFDGNPRLLLVGQKLAGGSATAAVPVGPIQSQQEADALFGVGSMLSDQFKFARLAAPAQPIWALPLADPAGNAAGGSYSLGAAPGVTGAGVLYVMNRRLTFQINAADTAAQVATNLAAAINAAGLAVTAAVDGTTTTKVNITARHVGTLGNSILLEIASDEPNALTAANTTIVAMTGGTGVPALDTPLANCGDTEFDYISGGYSDSVSLASVEAFLSDVNGRWSYAKQTYGGYFSANFGTLSANVTLGNAHNDPHVSVMGSQVSPSPLWQWAASYAGVACVHLSSAPELSRPLQTLELPGIAAPRDRSLWWAQPDRQALYADGIAGYKVDVDGTVRIDRAVTTYQQTAAGVGDATFRDVETMFQSMYAVRYLRSAVSNNHARQSLADENPYNVPEMATPKSIRNTLVHAYNDLVALGVAENQDVFAQYLVVTRNAEDANRVDAYIPIDFVNQLRVFAANITAFLQYQTASGDTTNVPQ
jgi:phage tail sheath gpL-like